MQSLLEPLLEQEVDGGLSPMPGRLSVPHNASQLPGLRSASGSVSHSVQHGLVQRIASSGRSQWESLLDRLESQQADSVSRRRQQQ